MNSNIYTECTSSRECPATPKHKLKQTREVLSEWFKTEVDKGTTESLETIVQDSLIRSLVSRGRNF